VQSFDELFSNLSIRAYYKYVHLSSSSS